MNDELPKQDEQPEIPELKKEDRETRGGALLPGAGTSSSGGAAYSWGAPRQWTSMGRLLRGLDSFRQSLPYRIFLGTPVGKGLTLGFALAGSTFILGAIAERMPQASTPLVGLGFPDRIPKRPASQAQWDLMNEGMVQNIPSKASMLVTPESLGSVSEEAKDASITPPSVSEGESAEEPAARGGAAPTSENLAERLAEKLGLGKGALSDPDGKGRGGAGRGSALGGANRIAASQGFLQPFSQPSLGGKGAGARGPATAGGRRSKRAVSSALTAKAASGRGAMGQLRFANKLSGQGNAAGGHETSAAYSAAAFDQQNPGEGGAGIGLDGGDRSPRGSGMGADSGGGGSSAGEPAFGAMPVEAAGDETPYDDLLDRAKDLQDQAKKLKKQGTTLIAIGLVIIAIGIMMTRSGNPWVIGGGIALILAGGYIVYSGMELVAQAKSMADESKQIGQRISGEYGQQEQGEIVEQGADDSMK